MDIMNIYLFRLFVAFSDIYEITLTIVFVCTIIAVSITLLLLQMEIVEYHYITGCHFHFVVMK